MHCPANVGRFGQCLVWLVVARFVVAVLVGGWSWSVFGSFVVAAIVGPIGIGK